MHESTRHYLNDLRKALLYLHKVLLEIERITYEQAHGHISSGELLQHVIQDEHFAWLRSLSEFIVRIDELLDTEVPVEEAEAQLLLTQARTLLVPSEEGNNFARSYYKALQREPSAVLAHKAVKLILLSGKG